MHVSGLRASLTILSSQSCVAACLAGVLVASSSLLSCSADSGDAGRGALNGSTAPGGGSTDLGAGATTDVGAGDSAAGTAADMSGAAVAGGGGVMADGDGTSTTMPAAGDTTAPAAVASDTPAQGDTVAVTTDGAAGAGGTVVDTTGTGVVTTGAAGAAADTTVSPLIDSDDTVVIEATTPVPSMGEGGGNVCSEKDIAFESLVPTVMILVDKSSSMFAPGPQDTRGDSPAFGASVDRWTAVRDGLNSLEELSKDVAMSVVTYTSDATKAATCPIMGNLEQVPVIENFAAIQAALDATADASPRYKGETPTAEGITAAAAALLAAPGDGGKYLLLATDGEPDTCLHFDPQCGQDPAVAAVQAAYAAGIQTFVIAVGDDAGDKFLNDIAHAGAGLEVQPPIDNELHCIQTHAQDRGETFDYNDWRVSAAGEYGADALTYAETLYLQPGDDAALKQELSSLVAGTRTCEFEMDVAVVRAEAGKGYVRITKAGVDTQLDYEGANGWTLSADNDYTVVIQGTYCDDILTDISGEVSLRIEFPCEVQTPIIR